MLPELHLKGFNPRVFFLFMSPAILEGLFRQSVVKGRVISGARHAKHPSIQGRAIPVARQESGCADRGAGVWISIRITRGFAPAFCRLWSVNFGARKS